MKKSKFIRGGREVRCLGCGSSLIREEFNHITGTCDKSCFVCGAGELAIKKLELLGLCIEDVKRILGREEGDVGQILTRLNTPGAPQSTSVTSAHAIQSIKEAFKIKDDLPH